MPHRNGGGFRGTPQAQFYCEVCKNFFALRAQVTHLNAKAHRAKAAKPATAAQP